MRRHIPRRRLPPIPPIPPKIIKHHVRAQQARDEASAGAKRRRRDEGRLVLGLLVFTEDVAGHEAHDVGQGHADGREHDATALVGDVVVVPGGQEDRGRGGAPDHHEGGIVCELDLALDVVDGGVDDEADEGEGETKHDEWETDAEQIRAEGEDEQHHGTADIWCDSVEIRHDKTIAETLDDLRHEQRHRLNRHTETDFNEQEAVRRRVLEDTQGVSEVELLGHDGGRVDEHSVVGEALLLLVEELGLGGAARQVPEGEDGEEDGSGALDDEEVSPDPHVGFDMEDAVGQEAALSTGLRRGLTKKAVGDHLQKHWQCWKQRRTRPNVEPARHDGRMWSGSR